jgi:hypothetical protein
LSVKPGVAAAMTSMSAEKWQPFKIFFQSRDHVVIWQSQIQRIGWLIKTLEAQVGWFLLGCNCRVSRGIVMQEQDPLPSRCWNHMCRLTCFLSASVTRKDLQFST